MNQIWYYNLFYYWIFPIIELNLNCLTSLINIRWIAIKFANEWLALPGSACYCSKPGKTWKS